MAASGVALVVNVLDTMVREAGDIEVAICMTCFPKMSHLTSSGDHLLLSPGFFLL